MPEFVLPQGENEEPVQILVKMVRDGVVDPWNIDIADLTDKFMTELEARRQMNLRVSGLTIFYLSVLLRLKAESLQEPAVEEDDDFFNGGELFEDEESGGYALGQIEQLEHEIKRRLKRKDVRKRHTNLYELIKELRLAEKSERRRQRRQRLIESDDDMFAMDTEEIEGMAHEENYEELADRIYDFIARYPDSSDTGVSIYEICAAFHWPPYLVYLPCLFLVQLGRVDLEQEEIFGDLWVVLCPNAPASASATGIDP